MCGLLKRGETAQMRCRAGPIRPSTSTAIAAPRCYPADTNDSNPEPVQVTASIPTAVEYSHIHFGVWAGLTDNEGTDNYLFADLGIGFVQNHDGSGVTSAHVIWYRLLQRRLGCCRCDR